MGTAAFVVTLLLFWKQVSFRTVSYHLPLRHGTRPPSLAPAPTTSPEANSSSPWVVYLSISMTGNGDESLSKAPRRSYFSPHGLFSLQLYYCSVRMKFGAATPFLFSVPRARKINGGLLGGSGDNEDYNRREIVSEEPHRCRMRMKSSRAFGWACFHSIDSA